MQSPQLIDLSKDDAVTGQFSCEATDLRSQKIKALLKDAEATGAELQKCREELKKVKEELALAAPYVSYETKLAIWLVQRLPKFVRVALRRLIALGFALRKG